MVERLRQTLGRQKRQYFRGDDLRNVHGPRYGILAMHKSYRELGATIPDGNGFCEPKCITYGQALRVINKYLEDRLAELHLRWHVLAYVALKTAFPCATENTGRPAA